MFRRMLSVIGVAVFSVMVVGCGGSKTRAPVNESDVPDFVLNPLKAKGAIYGTGIAEQQSMQLAKETADLRARKEIATILSSKVSSILNDFLRSAGVGTEAEATELSESVTRSITQTELVGVTIERRDYIKGKMYSLAKYPLDNSMRELISKIVNNSLTSRSALLSEFRAKQGFEELDRQLEKLKESEPK